MSNVYSGKPVVLESSKAYSPHPFLLCTQCPFWKVVNMLPSCNLIWGPCFLLASVLVNKSQQNPCAWVEAYPDFPKDGDSALPQHLPVWFRGYKNTFALCRELNGSTFMQKRGFLKSLAFPQTPDKPIFSPPCLTMT